MRKIARREIYQTVEVCVCTRRASGTVRSAPACNRDEYRVQSNAAYLRVRAPGERVVCSGVGRPSPDRSQLLRGEPERERRTSPFDPRAGQGGQRYAECARGQSRRRHHRTIAFGPAYGAARGMLRRVDVWRQPERRSLSTRYVSRAASSRDCSRATIRASAGYAPAYGARADPAHPAVDPIYDRQVVDYDGNEHPGTIIIDSPHLFLYLVMADGKALRYGIGVGRPGFTWSGVKTITAMREWPDWIPPDDMLKRRPDLPRYMAGRSGKSARRARDVSRLVALPHPRLERALDHRHASVVRLHPHAQRRRHRPLRAREGRHQGRRDSERARPRFASYALIRGCG